MQFLDLVDLLGFLESVFNSRRTLRILRPILNWLKVSADELKWLLSFLKVALDRADVLEVFLRRLSRRELLTLNTWRVRH